MWKKYANGVMIFKFLLVLALFPPIMKPITIESNCFIPKNLVRKSGMQNFMKKKINVLTISRTKKPLPSVEGWLENGVWGTCKFHYP